MTAPHARLGVEIPEADNPELVTISGVTAYLSKKLKAGGAQGRKGTVSANVSSGNLRARQLLLGHRKLARDGRSIPRPVTPP